MGDGEGLDVLAAVRESDPSLSVVFVTAFATIELAVESMRQGAFDFVTKPFQPQVIRAAAKRACERTALLRENDKLREKPWIALRVPQQSTAIQKRSNRFANSSLALLPPMRPY